ncbi:putative holin [Chitiniphilus eburneus]|uniref:putative holin n=1 Tax=Chitiniphilus eburneus TaxID=2571148 RepID=UPI0035D05F28
MADPISTSTATTTVGAVFLLSLLPGLNPETVLGAFAGAIVFVISDGALSIWKRLLSFVLSFIAGLIAAGLVAGLIDTVMPRTVTVSPGVGALVAAAVAIRILQWLIRRAGDPDAIVNHWRTK